MTTLRPELGWLIGICLGLSLRFVFHHAVKLLAAWRAGAPRPPLDLSHGRNLWASLGLGGGIGAVSFPKLWPVLQVFAEGTLGFPVLPDNPTWQLAALIGAPTGYFLQDLLRRFQTAQAEAAAGQAVIPQLASKPFTMDEIRRQLPLEPEGKPGRYGKPDDPCCLPPPPEDD